MKVHLRECFLIVIAVSIGLGWVTDRESFRRRIRKVAAVVTAREHELAKLRDALLEDDNPILANPPHGTLKEPFRVGIGGPILVTGIVSYRNGDRVELAIGSDDGVRKVGLTMVLYRKGATVGCATIEGVSHDYCVARIIFEDGSAPIAVGDEGKFFWDPSSQVDHTINHSPHEGSQGERDRWGHGLQR